MSTVDDKTEVREYFNTEGFNRWNKIYSDSDEVNSVQLDIRSGHDQTIQKILNWIEADGDIRARASATVVAALAVWPFLLHRWVSYILDSDLLFGVLHRFVGHLSCVYRGVEKHVMCNECTSKDLEHIYIIYMLQIRKKVYMVHVSTFSIALYLTFLFFFCLVLFHSDYTTFGICIRRQDFCQ